MEDDFIDIEQTAKLVGLGRESLGQLRYRGDGPPFYAITPRKIRYRRGEVLAWMASKRRGSTADAALAK